MRADHPPQTFLQLFVTSPMLYFYVAMINLLYGAGYFFRLFPSLKPDMIVYQNMLQPTAHVIHNVSVLSFLSVGVFLFSAFWCVKILDVSRRLRIASLPRWQQWLTWPFHGQIAPGAAVPHPPLGR